MDYFDTIPKYPKTDNFKMLGIILTYRTNFKNQKCSLPFSFPYSLYYFIIFFFFLKIIKIVAFEWSRFELTVG